MSALPCWRQLRSSLTELVNSVGKAMKNNEALQLLQKATSGKGSVLPTSRVSQVHKHCSGSYCVRSSIQRKLEAFAGSLLPSHCADFG